jgi:hypothetical protein
MRCCTLHKMPQTRTEGMTAFLIMARVSEQADTLKSISHQSRVAVITHYLLLNVRRTYTTHDSSTTVPDVAVDLTEDQQSCQQACSSWCV